MNPAFTRLCRVLVTLSAIGAVPGLAPVAPAAAHAATTTVHDGLLVAQTSVNGYAYRADDPTTQGDLFPASPPCPGDTRPASSINALTWSHDGLLVAGLRNCSSGDQRLEVMDADGSNPRFYLETSTGWSASTTLMWNSTDDGLFVDTDTGDVLVTIADGIATPTAMQPSPFAPVSAPDGHQALWCDSTYDYATSTNYNDVCVYDPLSGATTSVATHLAWQSRQSMSWSPDGQHLAFTCGNGMLCMYDVATASTHTVVDFSAVAGGSAFGPVWSPDSAMLMFQGRDGTNSGIFSLNADGSGAQYLFGGMPIGFSPSGQLVEYWMKNSGVWWVTISRLDGTQRVFVTKDNPLMWQACATATCPGPRALTAPCTITGTAGADVLVGTPGDDVICAGGGNDRIIPGGGSDVVRAGAGTNTLDYRTSPHPMTVSLRSGISTGWGNDIFFGIQNVQGSAYDDVLKGDDNRNVLSGNGGNDDLLGYGGDDTLLGGPGNDYFRGGLGGDDIVGDDGSDRVSYSDASQRVRVNLASEFATGEGEDFLVSIERISGSRFDDFLVGSDGRNVIVGGDGIDTIEAGGGNDSVYGGDDKDYLYGQGGDDTLDGQGGSDYVNGGAGDDDCYSAAARVSC